MAERNFGRRWFRRQRLARPPSRDLVRRGHSPDPYSSRSKLRRICRRRGLNAAAKRSRQERIAVTSLEAVRQGCWNAKRRSAVEILRSAVQQQQACKQRNGF